MAKQLMFERKVIDTGVVSLVSEIDGTSLTELVAEYEETREYTPVGGYGGIVPRYFRYGDLSKYYLGLGDRQWPAPGELWLLGCQCGEAGCWPLEARVTVTDATVVWSHFRQPHRPARDYSHFGPFEFDRVQFDAAIQEAISGVET